MSFWDAIDAQLDAIEHDKPDTAKGVIDALGGTPESHLSSNEAHFGGSGGDRTLYSALRKAGWRMVWAEADYYYVAMHRTTRELLTYIEGDVDSGVTASAAVGPLREAGLEI